MFVPRRHAEATFENNARRVVFDSENFRMKFDVRHHLASTLNSIGRLTIYNLSQDTENDLMTRNTQVRIRAGYNDDIAYVYVGSVLRVQRGRESGTDRYLQVHLRSGLQAERVITIAREGPLSVQGLIVYIVNKIVDTPPFEKLYVNSASLNHIPITATRSSFAYTGPAKGALSAALSGIAGAGSRRATILADGRPFGGKRYRLSWTIRNAEVVIIKTEQIFDPNGDVRDREGLEAPLNANLIRVSEKNGMLDVPEQLEAGIKVKTLLRPHIKTDDLLEVILPDNIRGDDGYSRNTFYTDKQWRITSVRHNGDTWRGEYFTEVEGRKIETETPTEEERDRDRGFVGPGELERDERTGRPV